MLVDVVIQLAGGQRDAGRQVALEATAQLLALLLRQPDGDAEGGRGTQGPLAATEQHVPRRQLVGDEVPLPLGLVAYIRIR